MTTKTEVQALLRFLSQDAKVPLPTAMSKIKELQKAQLTTPESLSRISITNIQAIFQDEKQAKAILAAAKRVSKKRTAGETTSSPSKRSKSSSSQANPFLSSESLPPDALEASLALPTSSLPVSSLREIVIHTNRAPLVLAFAVTLLKYTMPAQPLSSRLSLAQAVVSANSRSKAVSLGLENGRSAEEEGWGQGQPRVKVMGREVRVLKRWGYEWKRTTTTVKDEEEGQQSPPLPQSTVDGHEKEESSTQSTLKHDEEPPPLPSGDLDPDADTDEPALWGLDLEALRSSSSTSSTHQAAKTPSTTSSTNNLPIHTPQSARAYLLKSFTSSTPSPTQPTKTATTKTAAQANKDRETNLGHLLAALDVLFTSWTTDTSAAAEHKGGGISADELDRRAWGWYVAVRPDVASGVGGWGGKGDVALRAILDLERR